MLTTAALLSSFGVALTSPELALSMQGDRRNHIVIRGGIDRGRVREVVHCPAGDGLCKAAADGGALTL